MTAVAPIAAAAGRAPIGLARPSASRSASPRRRSCCCSAATRPTMAAIWWNSSTFNHCLFIPPIIGWLVWQRWPELRAAGAAPPGGRGCCSSRRARAAGCSAMPAASRFARHLGLVLMLQGAVVACLGQAVARGLLFPLGYALFLVPVGEELVPPLQTLTAKMCMALLALAGVPAQIEGVFITTPNGYFEVAEACSGVKFLVAMVALGALVANVCFRAWPRRLAFMAAALVVPILANGVRAFGTIYVAHRTGSVDLAAGFDHVVYGWIFFAVVIALMMALGWRFFDRGVERSLVRSARRCSRWRRAGDRPRGRRRRRRR